MKRLKALLVAAMILQPFASVHAQEAVNPETPQVEQVAPASESPVSSTESSNPTPTAAPATPTAQPATQGKELTDVVTDVDLLDGDNNIASPDAPYRTVESAYRKAKFSSTSHRIRTPSKMVTILPIPYPISLMDALLLFH